jgi:hypothetical protein
MTQTGKATEKLGPRKGRQAEIRKKAAGQRLVRKPETPQPNTFELKGEYIKVTYALSSFAGPPQLTYEDAGGVKQFNGNEIRQVDTEIGRLVTVSTHKVEGAPVPGTTLTILIPLFNFEEKDLPFTTWAITTTRMGPEKGADSGGRSAPEGALQTYRVDQLRGTASKVFY